MRIGCQVLNLNVPTPFHAARLATTATLLIALMVATGFGEDWPQFRGINSTGVSTSNKSLPTKFSLNENLLWSEELGEGIACPIVSGGRVFATSMIEKQKLAVFAFDAASGERLWQKEFETGPLPHITPPNTPASSTPVSDGERVYVYFSTLGMLAFDAADGNLIWKHPIQLPFYLMEWGAANSPMIHEDKVVFCQDDDLDPFILALDKYSGKVAWRTPRPDMLGGYAVPVVCSANGRTDLVVAGTGKFKGYDPATGKERWSCNTLLRTIMTTPSVEGDVIYMSSQSYGDTDRVLKYALLQWADTNQDQKLSKNELDKVFWKKFDKGDKNKDGFLVDDEIDAAFQSPGNMAGGGHTIQAVRGGGSGDVTKTHLLWNIDNKSPSNIASQLVVDGRVFVVKRGGISAAFNTKNGEKVWMKKRIRNLGNYYASPIAGDGKIFVAAESGHIVVLKQGPKLKVLAKNDMGESCVATPAIADGRIYVRTLNKLYCFSEEAK